MYLPKKPVRQFPWGAVTALIPLSFLPVAGRYSTHYSKNLKHAVIQQAHEALVPDAGILWGNLTYVCTSGTGHMFWRCDVHGNSSSLIPTNPIKALLLTQQVEEDNWFLWSVTLQPKREAVWMSAEPPHIYFRHQDQIYLKETHLFVQSVVIPRLHVFVQWTSLAATQLNWVSNHANCTQT